MTTLFWPGDERAGGALSDEAFVRTMIVVESAWLRALSDAGIAPDVDWVRIPVDLDERDLHRLALAAEASGTPVIPLVTLLRERLGELGQGDAAAWLHRGLTSQDVVDSALVRMTRDAQRYARRDLHGVVPALAELAERHRATAMVGRTLTQSAVPIRFGTKVSSWLQGVLDAAEDLDRLRFPAQIGGAAGTRSGLAALAAPDLQAAVLEGFHRQFGSDGQAGWPQPWHTDRAPLTRIADAFAGLSAACGHIANDVLTLSRPEIGELREGTGGGSSTMPQKANPVLAVLVRRAALAAPGLLSTLHLAAADAGDERPAGAWHLEWQPLQQLVRHALVAVSQTLDLVRALQVDVERMAANLAAADGIHGERDALTAFAGTPTAAWTGTDDALVDAALARAAAWLSATT